ncbi:MAG: hypothetical protein R6V10_13140 [bacterium]
MKLILKSKAVSAVVTFLALGMLVTVYASNTGRWDIESFKDWSRGEFQGVEISSKGEIRPAGSLQEYEVSAEGVWSLARGEHGAVYMGTGNKGRLLRHHRGKTEEIFNGDHVAITRIRKDDQGRIWFSALPGGAIYRRDQSGEVKRIAETGEEYVWDFIIHQGRILAATGPHGKILSLSSSSGKVKDVIETGEEHVMCLTRTNGKIYAGTSGEGLVIELKGKESFRVVHDFEEKEVRRLSWVGEGEEGTLVAAVNQDVGSRPAGRSSRVWSGSKKDKNSNNDDENGDDKGPRVKISAAAVSGGEGKVSGAVYAVSGTGTARKLVSLSKIAAVDMAVSGKDVYISTDQEGKVYRCRPDSPEYSIAFDVEPAQVLSLLANQDGLSFLGTGSPAGLYKVKPCGNCKARYTTPVLDADFPARWGKVDWEATGLLKIKTRSGNIEDTSRGWSDWKLILSRPGQIRSEDARYLQLRIEWPLASDAVMKNISIPYRIHNQPHYVEKVAVDDSEEDNNNSNKKVTITVTKNSGKKSGDTERKIKWKTNNPDEDPLLYRLYFQPEDADTWIPIETREPLTKTMFEWETESVPDGWYRIKVVATDTPVNPPSQARSAEGVSERFLVDNHAPEIKMLAVIGNKVTGKAKDKVSAITVIQYSIDGGPWTAVAASDGVLDTRSESFSFELPPDLEPGSHIIAIRAWDRALNLGSEQKKFKK